MVVGLDVGAHHPHERRERSVGVVWPVHDDAERFPVGAVRHLDPIGHDLERALAGRIGLEGIGVPDSEQVVLDDTAPQHARQDHHEGAEADAEPLEHVNVRTRR